MTYHLSLALVLLLAVPAWGRVNFNGSTDKATSATVEDSTVPLSLCAWVRSEDDTASRAVISIGDTASDNNYFLMDLAGATAGDPVRCIGRDAVANGVASTSTGFTANTWHHVCCVQSASNSRTAYIDGGSAVTDTTSATPAGVDSTGVGFLERLTEASFFDGDIAEVVIYNIALAASEVAELAEGMAPPCVRREAIVAYYPMDRDTTFLRDLFGVTLNNLTLTGTSSAAHVPQLTNCQ